MRPSGPADGIVPKTVHRTQPKPLFIYIKMTLIQLFSVRSLPDLPEK